MQRVKLLPEVRSKGHCHRVKRNILWFGYRLSNQFFASAGFACNQCGQVVHSVVKGTVVAADIAGKYWLPDCCTQCSGSIRAAENVFVNKEKCTVYLKKNCKKTFWWVVCGQGEWQWTQQLLPVPKKFTIPQKWIRKICVTVWCCHTRTVFFKEMVNCDIKIDFQLFGGRCFQMRQRGQGKTLRFLLQQHDIVTAVLFHSSAAPIVATGNMGSSENRLFHFHSLGKERIGVIQLPKQSRTGFFCFIPIKHVRSPSWYTIAFVHNLYKHLYIKCY